MPVSKWIEMAIEAKVDPPDFSPESGESPAEVRNRARESLKNIISEVLNFISMYVLGSTHLAGTS